MSCMFYLCVCHSSLCCVCMLCINDVRCLLKKVCDAHYVCVCYVLLLLCTLNVCVCYYVCYLCYVLLQCMLKTTYVMYCMSCCIMNYVMLYVKNKKNKETCYYQIIVNVSIVCNSNILVCML